VNVIDAVPLLVSALVRTIRLLGVPRIKLLLLSLVPHTILYPTLLKPVKNPAEVYTKEPSPVNALIPPAAVGVYRDRS